MEQTDKPPGRPFRSVSIVVTLATYFFLKYFVAARMFDLSETNNFIYTIGLILTSVLFGGAVERWLESRKAKED